MSGDPDKPTGKFVVRRFDFSKPLPKPETSLPRRCTKCGGRGRLGKYKHIENGKCFDCNGSGVAMEDEIGKSEANVR